MIHISLLNNIVASYICMYVCTYVYIYIYVCMYVYVERERERYRRYTYSVCVYICVPKKDSQPWSGVRMGLESICLTTWWWFESMNMHNIYIYNIYIYIIYIYICPGFGRGFSTFVHTDRWAGATLCLAPRPGPALRWESGFPSRISLKIVLLCSGY